MPISPLIQSRNTYHKRETTFSSPSSEGQEGINDIEQRYIGNNNSSAFSRLMKDALKDLSEVKEEKSNADQPLLNMLSQRRESASSIGLSFQSEKCTAKSREI